MTGTEGARPETNVYRVRKDTRLAQGLFLCKVILKKQGSLQIEGMGEPISLVAKFAQILTKDGYTVIKSVSAHNAGEGRSINPKLVISLSKAPQFDKLTEHIVLKDTPK